MWVNRGILTAAFAGLLLAIAHVGAQGAGQQQPPAAPPQQAQPPAQAPTQPPAQPPGGRGRGPATFPAQQRALADPATIARGKTLFEVNCRACHGPDLRGGDMGGPNLLRSQLVLNDQHGELIVPVVKNGRQTPGLPPMPPLPLQEDDVKAVAEYIHSVAATMRGQGNPPPGSEGGLNIVVGDAAAGQKYFASKCASCHSPTGDLQGLATRVSDPTQLQNFWITGGGGFGRGGRGGAAGSGRGRGGAPEAASDPRQVMVTVTPPSGPKVEGRLERIDDFMVVLTTADGTQRSFSRNGDVPKVEIKDPLEPHRQLLTTYTDKDIHDLTAYLVTLK
jgi:cytochrome c oxidase cbb3-type subunit III